MRHPRFPARVLCAFLIAGLFAANTALAQTPARTLSDTVPLDPDGEVVVDNHEGRIIVDTWDRDEVKYEIRIMPTDEDPEAERTTIEVDHRDDRLSLATTHEEGDDESGVFGFSFEDGWQWGGNNIPDVHYVLTVPRTAQLAIDDHESEIEVTGLQGALRIDTHEGPITVTDSGGDVFIDNHESPMDLRGIASDLEIDTHEGRIDLEDHRGDVLIDCHDSEMDLRAVTGLVEIDTHEGEIELDELRGGFRLDDLFARGDALDVKLSHFETDGEDFIDSEVKQPSPPARSPPNCNGTTRSVNVGRAELWGQEIEGDYRAGRLRLALGFSRVDGRDRETGDRLGVLTPPQVTLDVGYALPRLDSSVGGRLLAADDFDKVDDPADERDGYEVVDLYYGWQPKAPALRGLQVRLGVDNAFDEEYARVFTGATEPGRNVKLNLAYTASW